MDEADLGNEMAERYLNGAIAKARNRTGCNPSLHAEYCIACGDPIPEARRQAVPEAIRCAGCQTEFELERRGY